MKAQGIYMVEPGKVEVRELDVPDPGPGEVQVRCLANGICMGEVSLFLGWEPLSGPRLVGHEGVGVVTKLGPSVGGLAEGDIVTCGPWASVSNYPASALCRFTSPPTDPATALAEPVACVVGALYSYDITPGDRVLLLGAGFMGLLNVQGVAHSPVKQLVVVDVKPENLELAARFGATEVLQAGTTEADERLGEIRQDPFDLVIEAAGVEATLQQAGALTRPGGRLAIFAWHHHPRTVDFGLWHVRGLRVLNSSPQISRDRNVSNMKRAVDLIERGVFDLAPLVTHRHRICEAQEAMELAAERPRGYVKGVFLFD